MPPRGRNEGNITIENARIVFRNFQGKEGQYNREGDRNFAVILEDIKLVKQLEKDGWNVKYLKAREEGDDEQPYLQVSVGYKGRPPHVVMITSRGRNELGENEVDILDWADISNVDLIIRPYNWNVSDKSGIKAYLKSMFVTIEEDELERKYAHIDDVPTRSGRVDD